MTGSEQMLRAELFRCEDERRREHREWSQRLQTMAAERDAANKRASDAMAALVVEVLRANMEKRA